MSPRVTLGELKATILHFHPELRSAEFSLLTAGWDSVAVDVDDRLIFRFPKHPKGASALRREARLLDVVRPAVSLPLPALTIHDGPPAFSRHKKLPGEHLLTAQYERLPEEARDALAAALAQFYAEIHALDANRMRAAGAGPVAPWLVPDDILRRAVPALPSELQGFAERMAEAWRNLPSDPYGETYGFFDGHGWNMAFDHEHQRLNGLYDFGDSGFGPLHQEFVYSSMISPDLTERLVMAYSAMTGRPLDRWRIYVLTAAMRLTELADYAHDAEHAAIVFENVRLWAELPPSV